MDLNKVYVVDLEARGLYNDIRTFDDLHILGVGYLSEGNWKIKTTTSFEDIQKLFGNKDNIIVIHNGIRYDKPVLEKMGIEVKATIICSLALAWNLLPNRSREGKKYGLEAFGEDFGVPKPVVHEDEWKGISDEDKKIIKEVETYSEDFNSLPLFKRTMYSEAKKRKQEHADLMKFRVTEDIKINIQLWTLLYEKLKKVYSENFSDAIRLIHLLNFIMECAFQQEMSGLKVDEEKVLENLKYFEALKEVKTKELVNAMPKVPIKSSKSKPKNMFKKDGTLSKAGETWMLMIHKLNLPEDYEGDIEIIKGYEEANPNSVKQKKEWLYSLGWKPETWKFNRDKITGKESKVEQLFNEEKELCSSVLKLKDKSPAIEALEGLGVITHRIGLLKGFLKNRDSDGIIIQWLQQLAVTMRWQHGNIVNLPKYTGKGDLRDGNWIRECLVAPDGFKIVQADLSGIESRTSDHYTFHINPKRISKTKQPYFDPHTEIAVTSGLMSPAEETFYIFKGAVKDDPTLDIRDFSEIYKYNDEVQKLLDLPEDKQNELLKHLKTVRSKGKTTNYASLYLVGANTLSRNLEIPKKEAQELIDAYWNIHFAVKKFSESLEVKKVGDEEWVFNPISKFWYYVRNSKDLFSIINQSSAVYCFNMWIYFITKRGVFPVNQTHDDAVLLAKDGDEERVRQIFHDAMDDVNKYLRLNILLDCESQIGNNLAETH